MMKPDWKALAPHRPLLPGDARYVSALTHGGDDIAERLIAGTQTILVGGPAGIGKSTELAYAAARLDKTSDRVACFLPLDTWENMRRITPDQLLLRIAGFLAYFAVENLRLPVSHDLLSSLAHAGMIPSTTLKNGSGATYQGSPDTLAWAVISEITRLATPSRVTLFIDGMEKVPPGPSSTELFDALASLPDAIELVVVVPWHAAFGPHAETVIRAGEHWEILHPPRLDGVIGEETRAVLRQVLARRLDLDVALLDEGPSAARVAAKATGDDRPLDAFAQIVEEAAIWSGGLPRIFLQLVADSGTYARLRRNEDWPNSTDLADAVADLEDSFRRALLPGDTDAVLGAAGTDGRELDLDRKVRLLSRGILIERRDGRRVSLDVHPLAQSVLLSGG